jgi:GalNAc-alpha-(1->4)-GalNAc-alpha-(1->3)-diNAcBac-PP-undecaprenol alpha-1,4-N-acetyl-D-galactosaminyltransferase
MTLGKVSESDRQGAQLHIACVIYSMGPDGAQRVMAQLLAHFVSQGHQATLITFETSDDQSFFPLDSRVRVLPLGRASEGTGLGRVGRVVGWVHSIRRAVIATKPDVVISFIDLTNVMVLLATRGLGLPVIVSERIDPHHHAIGRVGTLLRRLTYPKADRLVVQTARAARYFTTIPPARLITLANPVPPARLQAQPDLAAGNGRWRIIGVGRLDRQKGFDLLIAAFARLAERFSAWDVVVFGKGVERVALQHEIDRHGLGQRVVLAAPSQSIGEELAASHIFAFPSRYEGFPNALAEAMAAGLPCVAFADVSGVEDLIGHEQTGLLCQWGHGDDAAIESLAGHLARLMENSQQRLDLGDQARRAIEAFAPSHILQAWDQLVLDVIQQRKAR